MLSLPPSVRVFLATEPADMRKSIDGLTALVQEVFGETPFSGHLFVFRNRRRDRAKILVWDGSGFWVMYKRLEKGRFHFPQSDAAGVRVSAADLTLLLEGIDLAGARRRRAFTPKSAREALG